MRLSIFLFFLFVKEMEYHLVLREPGALGCKLNPVVGAHSLFTWLLTFTVLQWSDYYKSFGPISNKNTFNTCGVEPFHSVEAASWSEIFSLYYSLKFNTSSSCQSLVVLVTHNTTVSTVYMLHPRPMGPKTPSEFQIITWEFYSCAVEMWPKMK